VSAPGAVEIMAFSYGAARRPTWEDSWLPRLFLSGGSVHAGKNSVHVGWCLFPWFCTWFWSCASCRCLGRERETEWQPLVPAGFNPPPNHCVQSHPFLSYQLALFQKNHVFSHIWNWRVWGECAANSKGGLLEMWKVRGGGKKG
jgi:hypothetical protein